MSENFEENNKKNTILFILTFICILFFIILMLKSYQIYNKQNNLDSLETVISTQTNIKEKINNTENNFNIPNINNSYYDELDKNQDEINQIILNIDNNNTKTQEKTINDLLEENTINTIAYKNESTELDNMINNIENNYNMSENKFIVQVASLKNRIYAEKYIDNIKKHYPDIIKNININIKESNDSYQTFYRIQFEIFDTKNNAEEFCEKLKTEANIQTCIILKK